jgi:hypothetical protein
MIYIPTLGRAGAPSFMKTIPAWLDQGIRVRLVVERNEFADYARVRRDMGWDLDIVTLPQLRKGIGNTRAFIVRHAASQCLRSIIMSNDDYRPAGGAKAGSFRPLLRAAARPGVLGIGAVNSVHDRFTSGAITRLAGSGTILCPGGWGFNVFALNVQMTIKVGNFDPLLHTDGEDAELARQGISKGIPWMVHVDSWVVHTGTKYAPGGIAARHNNDREALKAAEAANRALIHERWPDYVSAPGRRYRQSWQKMLDDYIPDWRSRSALHGGHL